MDRFLINSVIVAAVGVSGALLSGAIAVDRIAAAPLGPDSVAAIDTSQPKYQPDLHVTAQELRAAKP